MYILDGNVTTAVVDAIRSLMITFCSLIYKLIIFSFDVFEKIGSANDILSTDIIVNITNKISLILGLFMIFRLTFAFIQYLINPDTMSDKNKGAASLVIKVVVTIVLLGSTPYMFKLAFSLQNAINEDRIIPRIIVGHTLEEDENVTMGGMLAQSTFFTFFRVNENVTCKDSDEDLAIVTTNKIEEDLKSANFTLLDAFVNQKCTRNDDDKKEDYLYEMDAGGFGCVAIGAAVLYIVFIFTIQLAVRLFQLAYLQIVAPLSIMMYVTPKGDEKLKKWGSQCLTTFLDYFLRTAIIYFVLFVIQQIIQNFESSSISNVWQSNSILSSAVTKGYVLGILIIGLLSFAKKVPNLIKELFPALGGAASFDYGLSFKKQVVEPLKSAYNTPLGWAPKLAKKGVASGVAAIDRKIYGLPKPRGKVGQAIDKWLPGQAEARKNRVQAQIEANQREDMLKSGANLNARYPKADDLVSEFKNGEYKESYMNLRKAKKATGEAELELEAVRSNLNTAMASGNREAIEIAKERLKTATDNLHSAQGNLELAKTRHESNKKIYRKDAEIENAYKYYADTHSERKDYDREMPDLGEQSQQEQINETLQEILRRQSGNTTTNESGEEYTDSSQETNDYTTIQPDVQARVDNITGVSRDSASSNGAPTEDNSLLGELADQVEQERLRNEVLNNLRNDNNGNNNGNR